MVAHHHITAQPDKLICMAKCARPKGLHGLLHLDVFMNDPESLSQYNPYHLYDSQQQIWSHMPEKLSYDNINVYFKHWHKTQIVVCIDGVSSRDMVTMLNGAYLYITLDQLDKQMIDDDEYYHVDLIGCQVIDYHYNNVGEIKYILDQSAQCLLEVLLHHCSAPILIPFHDTTIANVDIDKKLVYLHDAIDYWQLDK